MLVDGVSYDPVSPNALYPTAWAVFSDGSKEYNNTQTLWWSDNQQAAYVKHIQGSFAFGRNLIPTGSEATIQSMGSDSIDLLLIIGRSKVRVLPGPPFISFRFIRLRDFYAWTHGL